MSFNGVAEVFLADHLGGRSEPLSEDVKGSSITVPEGAAAIKGLQKVLGAAKGGGSDPSVVCGHLRVSDAGRRLGKVHAAEEGVEAGVGAKGIPDNWIDLEAEQSA